MKFKSLLLSLPLVYLTQFGSLSAVEKQTIGIVNFGKCIEASKFGKFEQKQFENVKNQMQKSVQELDEQLTDVATKLQNKDFLDSLSPEAEKELKAKFQRLQEEMNRYQGQYYQVMQQANMKLLHTMADHINQASELIAKREKLSLILNREAAFHYLPALDVTDEIIKELDKKFEKEGKTLEDTTTATQSK